jgi:hypothetical protein
VLAGSATKKIEIKGWVGPRDTVEWLQEKSLPLLAIEPTFFGVADRRLVNIPTERTLLIYQIRTVI